MPNTDSQEQRTVNAAGLMMQYMATRANSMNLPVTGKVEGSQWKLLSDEAFHAMILCFTHLNDHLLDFFDGGALGAPPSPPATP